MAGNRAVIILCVLIAALWYITLISWLKQRAMRKNGIVTIAVVTDARKAVDYRGSGYGFSRSERYTLRYQAPDGIHDYRCGKVDTRRHLAIGEQVEIVYRADKPEVAMLKREADSGGVIGFIAVCLITAVLVFVAAAIR